MDKSFDKVYAIEVPKLREGLNELEFEIDNGFFGHFEYSLIKEGSVHIKAAITKYQTHLDAVFQLKGVIVLHCDRCLEPYRHSFESEKRIIFSFIDGTEEDEDEPGEDVIMIAKDEPTILLGSEFYDFISLEAPLRKVPPPDVHLCAPEVLALLGLNAKGEKLEESGKEDIDPRWAKLKKLKEDDK